MRAHRWAALVVSVLITAIPLSAGASGDLLRCNYRRLLVGLRAPRTWVGPELRRHHDYQPFRRAGHGRLRDPDHRGARSRLPPAGARTGGRPLRGHRRAATGWTRASPGTTKRCGPGGSRKLDEPQPLPGALGARDSWDLEFLTVGMPVEAGNDTMTDRIDFDLVAHLATDTGEDTDVLGAQASSPVAESDGDSDLVPTAVDAGLSVLSLDALEKAEAERLIIFGTLGFVVLR